MDKEEEIYKGRMEVGTEVGLRPALHGKLYLIVQLANKGRGRETESDSQAIKRITILHVSVEQSQNATAGYCPLRNSDFNSNKQTSTNVWKKAVNASIWSSVTSLKY